MPILSWQGGRASEEWLRGCEREGYEALLEGARPGRPAELGEEERTRLADINVV